MGRSVDYLSHAEYVIYFKADWMNEQDDNGEYDEVLSEMNWGDFKGNLISNICSKLKSYYEVDEWDGREVWIFLKNELAEIGLSEYCGLYSLSIRARDDEFYNSYEKVKEGLAKAHCKKVRKSLEKALKDCGVDILNKIGTFSNGEAVYKLAK